MRAANTIRKGRADLDTKRCQEIADGLSEIMRRGREPSSTRVADHVRPCLGTFLRSDCGLIPFPDHSEFIMYGNDVMDLTILGLRSM